MSILPQQQSLSPYLQRFTIALLILLLGAVHAMAQTKDTITVDFESVLKQLLDQEADKTQVAEVENLTLQRDVGNFYLEKGKLYFCKPVHGQIYSAFFHGRGQFSFSPPTQMEKDHLDRFYETDTLTQKFKTLFLVFADNTEAELREKLDIGPGKVDRKANSEIEYALKYLGNKKKKVFEYHIIKTILDSRSNSLFYAHFAWDKIRPLFFQINPYASEEVQFMRRFKGPSYLTVQEVINQFHEAAQYEELSYIDEREKLAINIDAYRMDVRLEGRELELKAKAEIDFTMEAANQTWIALALYAELKIDSLFWGDGKAAKFVKGKDSPWLWVKMDSLTDVKDHRTLRLVYHGKLIERRKDWFYIKSSKGWYPRHGLRDYATFDLTFHYEDKFKFASVGEQVSRVFGDKYMTEKWQSSRPIRNASFNIGFFKEHDIENDTIPPVKILMAETGHREIGRRYAAAGIGSGRDMHLKVGKDINQSMQFFQQIYGEGPEPRYYVTEIPYTHGEAFPGLMHLRWSTFQHTLDDGTSEVFRAHEVAHQWWGIGIDFYSYHDQWLSEGFAEYSGWWYLQTVVQKEDEEKKFFDMLKHWRDQLVNNRNYLIGKGQEAAPIWMGYRTFSSDTEEDISLILYKKSAWVLHMLRMMHMDLETQSDSVFIDLMGTFYRYNRGSAVSTEAFIRHAESVVNADLGWFFDQWVYGNNLPRYQFAQKTIQNEDGSYTVQAQVLQNADNGKFKMPVVFGVQFDEEDIRPYRIMIEGSETQFEIGPFARKPQKLVMNHLESVLCDVKEIEWKK